VLAARCVAAPLLDGDCPLLSRLKMSGSAPFHQMVRIDTAAGEYVVAGDAAMLLSNVTNQWMPGIIDSMSGTMTGLKKLQPIVDRVLPTHDRVVAERFSHGIG
jgi:hypothetical protein